VPVYVTAVGLAGTGNTSMSTGTMASTASKLNGTVAASADVVRKKAVGLS
jgi:hypothetical protein